MSKNSILKNNAEDKPQEKNLMEKLVSELDSDYDEEMESNGVELFIARIKEQKQKEYTPMCSSTYKIIY